MKRRVGWCYCTALVIVASIVVLFRSLRTYPAICKRPNLRMARRALLASGLPDEWSWQRIDEEHALAYEKSHARRIAIGDYASPVFNQHMSNWCGCCYLVAVVQMLQDRMHLILGLTNPEMHMFPCFQFNMQLALDTYNAYEKKRRGDEWNACTGGMPTRVMNAIASNNCILRLVADRHVWMGHPNSLQGDAFSDDDERNIELEALESLEMAPDSIMRRIYKYGSIVLGINARCLLDPTLSDRNGLIDTRIVAPRDHAVTVVGWKRIKRRTCWILRNSWGTEEVPTAKPAPGCVGDDYNRCEVNRKTWIGDPTNPGHAYLPVDYEGLRGYPSPWLDAIPQGIRQFVQRSDDERHDLLENPVTHGHYSVRILPRS